MGKNLTWAAVVMLAALLQTTWLESIRLRGVLPDLVVLLVVYFAIVDGEERAMFTGLLGGFLYDIIGDATLGHHILALVVTAYLTGRIATRLITEHPAVKGGLVFGASLVNGFLHTVILYIETPQINALNTLASRVVPAAFYTTLVTPVLFVILDWSLRRFQPAHGGFS